MKPYIALVLKSRYSLYRPEDYLDIVRLHIDKAPSYEPTKWGITEPLRNSFARECLVDLVNIFKLGYMDDIYWKSEGKDRAGGSWNVVKWLSHGPRFTHRGLTIRTKKYQTSSLFD
jgi:hypothetical protein